MPQYIFKNPNTGEVKEVFQAMSDEHSYFEDGVKWDRVYTVPQASIDTKVDPFSQKQFIEKSYSKKGNMGNLWDASKEASVKRVDKEGYDPMQKKAAEQWSKDRGGKKAPKVLFGDAGE